MSTTTTVPLPEVVVEEMVVLYQWARYKSGDLNRWMTSRYGPCPTGDWDQSYYGKRVRNGECRTAYCIAGQEAVRQGYMFDFVDREFLTTSVSSQVYPVVLVPDEKGRSVEVPDVRFPTDPAELAREALGLTSAEADILFEGNNDLTDLWVIMSAICIRRGLRFPPRKPPGEQGVSVSAMLERIRESDAEAYDLYDGPLYEEVGE